jgi:hypothetical protein
MPTVREAQEKGREAMRSRMLIGTLVVAGLVAVGSAAFAGIGAPAVKWAVVNLPEPTMINGSFVMGQVIFQHDDERMARGEPCTKIYKSRIRNSRSARSSSRFTASHGRRRPPSGSRWPPTAIIEASGC